MDIECLKFADEVDRCLDLIEKAERTPCQFYYEITALIEQAHYEDVKAHLRSIQRRKRLQEEISCYGSC